MPVKKKMTKPEIEAPIINEPIIEEELPVYGVVSACLSLRIRKEPSMDGEILTTVPEGTHVAFKEENSDWYAVVLEDGTEGFAMSKFIH